MGRAAVTDRSTDEERAARQRTAQRQGLAYQGAFEAVIAILIGAGIGLWADQHFDTSPRYLLIGIVVGFTSFVLRLVRLGRQLHPDASAESEQDEQR
jgi:F0F1-type ATP synthase assembly protein I